MGRVRRQRTALVRSQARSLILKGAMTTTEAKAKELRPFVERLITKSKDDSVAARRLISSRLGNDAEAVQKLFSDIAKKYRERGGGYTRITKLSFRRGDGANMAVIELV